jgi:hypothetical protein
MRSGGPKPKPITTLDLEIYAWWQAKQAIGTFKSKANELGMKEEQVIAVVRRIRAQRDSNFREQRKFISSLRRVPF